jgi:hypothetical protein
VKLSRSSRVPFADRDLERSLCDIAARALVHTRQDRVFVGSQVDQIRARRLDGLRAEAEPQRVKSTLSSP